MAIGSFFVKLGKKVGKLGKKKDKMMNFEYNNYTLSSNEKIVELYEKKLHLSIYNTEIKYCEMEV